MKGRIGKREVTVERCRVSSREALGAAVVGDTEGMRRIVGLTGTFIGSKCRYLTLVTAFQSTSSKPGPCTSEGTQN